MYDNHLWNINWIIITDGGLSSTIIAIIMIVIIIVIVIVVIIIVGEFIKLLTLNDCYKFILVIVIKVKRKHSKPSGEYNYIII